MKKGKMVYISQDEAALMEYLLERHLGTLNALNPENIVTIEVVGKIHKLCKKFNF